MSEHGGSSLFSAVPWLARYLRPLLSWAIADLICLIVGSALSLLDPLVVKWLIDVALPKRDLRLVLLGTFMFCAVYLASLGTNYLALFVSCLLTQKMVFRIRVSLLRQIHALPTNRPEDGQARDTLYRIEQDVDRVAELSGDILPLAIQMVLMGGMVLVTMGILNWHLTLLVAPVLPIFYLLQQSYAAKLKDAADQVQTQSGRINAFLQEHLAGMMQLQLLNRTGTRAREFARLAATGAQLQIRQRATEMGLGGASVSVIVLGMGLILGYGGYEVTRGALTVGGLVAFYGYVFRLFAPASIAIDLQSRAQRVGASIRRIQEISETKPHSEAGRHATPLRHDITPDLEFRSVWFAYRTDRPVLRNMSFRVDAEEKVALVGLNGSGKSTIGLLATRLCRPDAGSIYIGGQEIHDVDRRSLRGYITLVPQDPFLFDQTIRQSLLYGNPNATNRDLDAVAALTQLDRILERLPKGLDEPLGSLGSRLSGGERKRLALARALLQQPRILIVDEVTSSLDAPTAAGLLEGLNEFRHKRTLVVVSHRPATILWADRILLVENGAIADSGKHRELIDRCEAYRKIWKFQDDDVPSTSPLSADEIGSSHRMPRDAPYNY
jgi:ABC-type multidrug transport system fused ATPase/permease subunit